MVIFYTFCEIVLWIVLGFVLPQSIFHWKFKLSDICLVQSWVDTDIAFS